MNADCPHCAAPLPDANHPCPACGAMANAPVDDEPSLESFEQPSNGRLRFVSPSLLVLAILTLPLPWVEVRCTGPGQSNSFYYRQTGTQILLDRATDIDPVSGRATKELTGDGCSKFRVVMAWLWFLVVLVGAGFGFFSHEFASALLHLILSCISFTLLAVLLIGIFIEEF